MSQSNFFGRRPGIVVKGTRLPNLTNVLSKCQFGFINILFKIIIVLWDPEGKGFCSNLFPGALRRSVLPWS